MAQAIDSNLISQLGLSDSTTKRKPRDKLGQGEFLKLMTPQLRNQEPKKPMDNGAVLGLISQFSHVCVIQDLHASEKQLLDTRSSIHAMQSSSLVCKTVVA